MSDFQAWLGYVTDPEKHHHDGYPPPPADEPRYGIVRANNERTAARGYSEIYMDEWKPGQFVIMPLDTHYQFTLIPAQRSEIRRIRE